MIPKLAVELQHNVSSDLIQTLEIDQWRVTGAENSVEPEEVESMAEHMSLSPHTSKVVLTREEVGIPSWIDPKLRPPVVSSSRTHRLPRPFRREGDSLATSR
jgi:hypothetical protein